MTRPAYAPEFRKQMVILELVDGLRETPTQRQVGVTPKLTFVRPFPFVREIF